MRVLPDYYSIAIDQARLFNPTCDIYLIADQSNLDKLDTRNRTVKKIATSSLQKTKEHVQFLKQTNKHGYWRYVSERFFYINALMQQFNLSDVFQLEGDVLLYVNLEELMPIFVEKYSGIGAVCHNDDWCVPGLMYFSNKGVVQKLAEHFFDYASQDLHDMQILGFFRKKHDKSVIDGLPVIMPEYIDAHGLKSLRGHTTKDSSLFCANIDRFQSVFDGAALGQYFGGSWREKGPGLVNNSCLFNSSYLTYEWRQDQLGRNIPYAIFNDKKYRINNLHIHSKELSKFTSTV